MANNRLSAPVIEALNLSPKTVTYYATWVKKAKLSQLKQIHEQHKIYLHLIAFVQRLITHKEWSFA